MNEILRAEALGKRAEDDGRLILEDVSFTLNRGEFVALMGPSGSGKSSLLSLVGLLDVPSAGRLSFLGRDVSALDDDGLSVLRAQSIGFIFQLYNLVPHLTVEQNILLAALYAGRRPDPGEARHWLGRTGMETHARDFPATLSGGERQRVAIARALVNRPALILADEPTGALDSASGGRVLDCLQDLHREGATIFLVTHDPLVAARAGRTMRLRDGRLEEAAA